MLYYFRGIKVFEYDPKTKEMKTFNDEIDTGNFNFCKFIPEDYKLFADFFEAAHKHATGEITEDELKDIEVY